tara:strand:- start:261 stop:575 length:315 start_codon:yes stop_codon:yes gene_type:complete
MKMKFEKINKSSNWLKLRPKDIIYMKTIYESTPLRYLVVYLNKRMHYIDVLLLEKFYQENENNEVPILSVPFDLIDDIKKADKTSLLFLANNENPHILKALEDL